MNNLYTQFITQQSVTAETSFEPKSFVRLYIKVTMVTWGFAAKRSTYPPLLQKMSEMVFEALFAKDML